MVKRVFIIHGWSSSPYSGWIPWLKSELEQKGFEVYAPYMPEPDIPDIQEWTHLLEMGVGKPDKETFFVGHSIGCQTILRYLQHLKGNQQTGGAVLVAPWVHLNLAAYEDQEDVETAKEWIETPIDWTNITRHTKKFSAIFSDNDPFVPIADSKIFQDKLGADITIENNKGHIDQESGIVKLQRILSELLKMAKN